MNIFLAPDFYQFQQMPLVRSLVPPSRIHGIATYEDVRDDDVFICTYPKAGTHWAADIANKVMCQGDLDSAKERRTEAYLEITPPTPSNVGALKGYMPQSLEELSLLPSPRIIMTHLHLNMLPSQVQQGKGKVIYVYRNPRDIAASLYPWLIYDLGLRGLAAQMDWSEYLENFNSTRNVFGAWYDHFKSCQDNADKANVLALKYEEMKQDLPGAVSTIADFLGKSLGSETVAAIAESCTFERFKAEHPDSRLLRKGISGDWKNMFTVAQSERMTEEIQRIKDRLGLIIDYQ